MKRPNVLFLLADDQQFDTIRALGNPAISTPNLDRLVARGTAFRNAYIVGGNIPAVCCPSRAMIHTGRPFFRIADVRDIGATLETMPETFRRAGYRTFATGKQHNGPTAVARGFDEAEALLFAGMGHHMRLEVQDFDPTGQYAPQRRQERRQYSSEMFTDAALRFLDRPGESPFFLYCAYTVPHDPMMAPAAYRALYDPQRVPFPASFGPQHPFDFSPKGDRVRPFQSCDECTSDAVVRFHHWPIEEGDLRELRALYYAMITHLDAQIGRLLDRLEQSGELDQTIIVFTADNGIAMGQHGCYHKQTCYDHDVHVPLLISGPGIPAGQERDDLVYLHDLYPTLGELAGVKPPPTVEGHSLLTSPSREALYHAYMETWRGVRDERFKLLAYAYETTRRTELFDLRHDPQELHDLAGDPGHAATLARLRAEMLRQRDAFGDTGAFWQHYG